jgi:hypothetical protein
VLARAWSSQTDPLLAKMRACCGMRWPTRHTSALPVRQLTAGCEPNALGPRRTGLLSCASVHGDFASKCNPRLRERRVRGYILILLHLFVGIFVAPDEYTCGIFHCLGPGNAADSEAVDRRCHAYPQISDVCEPTQRSMQVRILVSPSPTVTTQATPRNPLAPRHGCRGAPGQPFQTSPSNMAALRSTAGSAATACLQSPGQDVQNRLWAGPERSRASA